MTDPAAARLRRQPPAFEPVVVTAVARPVPRFVRLTLSGWAMPADAVDPAASIRVLLPGVDGLVMPVWQGNEFLLPSGGRPVIRTLTPLAADQPDAVAVAVFLHEGGPASAWAAAAEVGAAAAVSGPGRGWPVDVDGSEYVVAGDESALPAMGQVLDALPAGVPVRVVAQAEPDARLPLRPGGVGVEVEWCDDVAAAVCALELSGGALVWAAGEAAAVQRIRKHLFEGLGLPRSQTWVRGYWKRGRAGAED